MTMLTKFNHYNEIILTVVILIYTARPCSSCLVGCTCKHTKVTCEYVDVSVDDLKELKLSIEVTELYLRGNYLHKISSEVLKNLTHLKTLEISDNNIEYIPLNTFKDFNNLEKLILTKNKIRTLLKDMFTGLSNLLWLDLSENEISELQINTFEKLTQILDIRLTHNKLTFIPNSVFSNTKTLRLLFLSNNFIYEIHNQAFQNLSMVKLGLSFNRLTSIPVSAFKGFQITGKIVLVGNPLDCSCFFAVKYAFSLQHLQDKIWGYCVNPYSVRESNILDAHKKMFCSMCDMQPCLNEGECIGNKTIYVCKCGEQYKGDHREVDICRNSNRQTPSTTGESRNIKVLQENYRGSFEAENQTVINHTEEAYMNGKVPDKHSQTKLIVLYLTCIIESLIILSLATYIAYKKYKESKDKNLYNLRKTTRILFGAKNTANTESSKFSCHYSTACGLPGAHNECYFQ